MLTLRRPTLCIALAAIVARRPLVYAADVTDPPEFDPRAPLPRGHVPTLRSSRKSFRQWLSEPGAKLAVAISFGFFLVVYGFCLFSATMLAHYAGVESLGGLALLSLVMFGILLLLWAILAGAPKLLSGEGGILDLLFGGLIRKPGVAPELDDAPARLARKRGAPKEAIRLYRGWIAELPHRLDLRFHVADIQHHDLGDLDGALRGYRDFLTRVRTGGRPSPEERELIGLAEAFIADIERDRKDPSAPRIIQL